MEQLQHEEVTLQQRAAEQKIHYDAAAAEFVFLLRVSGNGGGANLHNADDMTMTYPHAIGYDDVWARQGDASIHEITLVFGTQASEASQQAQCLRG